MEQSSKTIQNHSVLHRHCIVESDYEMCRNSRYKHCFYERYHFQARALNVQLVCIIPHEYELNVDCVATNCILSTVLATMFHLYVIIVATC